MVARLGQADAEGNGMSESIRILRLDASANPGESSSRRLGDELLERLAREHANI